MILKRNRGIQQKQVAKDTLVIIGNGFDIWQGLNTSYSEFQKYYLKHRDEIMRKLRIKKKTVRYKDGQCISISDVELIYGDPFAPREIEEGFWNTFEESLGELDVDRVNLFFGKKREELRDLKKSLCNANKILREAFCGWIATIKIEEKEANYHFGDNCVFINFNYTDTLRRNFGVCASDEFHIHGDASNKKSIIFGHSSHPQLPQKELFLFGGRFRGAYFAERILYETDKHVHDNIHLLCMFLALRNVRVEEIKDIYVLGHSMGRPDIEYFAFLASATKMHNQGSQEMSSLVNSRSYEPLDESSVHVVKHERCSQNNDFIDVEQENVNVSKFEQEQAIRDQVFQKNFYKMVKRWSRKYSAKGVELADVKPRTEDARWHISCRSDSRKQWMESLMQEFGCKNYKFYSTIDECIESFEDIRKA